MRFNNNRHVGLALDAWYASMGVDAEDSDDLHPQLREWFAECKRRADVFIAEQQLQAAEPHPPQRPPQQQQQQGRQGGSERSSLLTTK
eukprot:SAG22_NODE_1364_length_4611_cov_3.558732_3_plen_88_part_00